MSAPAGVADPISPNLNREGFEQGISDGHRDGLQQCGWQDPDRVRAQQDEPSRTPTPRECATAPSTEGHSYGIGVWGEQAILPRPMYRRTAPNGRQEIPALMC